MVPLRSATTLLGTPALISDCAPMMLRVRPAQLTTTMVCGDGARSRTRSTSSAPGTLTAVGIETRWYSSNGRLSSTTMSLRSRMSRASSAASMLGVAPAGPANSANAVRGPLPPEDGSHLARDVDAGEQFEPGLGPGRNAAVERMEVGVARARENGGGALGKAIGVVAQHDARAPLRHQAGEFELEPAQRHRTREQEMALREDQLLA